MLRAANLCQSGAVLMLKASKTWKVWPSCSVGKIHKSMDRGSLPADISRVVLFQFGYGLRTGVGVLWCRLLQQIYFFHGSSNLWQFASSTSLSLILIIVRGNFLNEDIIMDSVVSPVTFLDLSHSFDITLLQRSSHYSEAISLIWLDSQHCWVLIGLNRRVYASLNGKHLNIIQAFYLCDY